MRYLPFLTRVLSPVLRLHLPNHFAAPGNLFYRVAITFLLFIFCITPVLSFSRQIPCNNWLNTPSNDSKVTVGDLDVVGDKITVEAIFNMDGPVTMGGPDGGKIVSKYAYSTEINYSLSPNGCEITTANNGHVSLMVCPAARNKTYHAAMVYDGATLKFYRNGFLMAQTACKGNLMNNDLLTTFGQLAGPVSGTAPHPAKQFAGRMNEVRIWNVARTQSEIQAYMYSSLPSSNETGLLGYYQFDGLTNRQGNPAFDCTLVNGASINQVNPNCTFIPDSCAVPPACNSWLNLPSQPSYVNVGDLDIAGDKLTVEAQINIKGFPPGGSILGLDVVSKHSDFGNVNYLLRASHAEISTTNGFFSTPMACGMEMNKTYHIAMVYDGASLKYYRNGFLMGQTACTGNMSQNDLATGIGFITSTIGPENMIGYVNEVRIWNVARSQAQVRRYMNSSLPDPATQSGLRGYYRFDDLLNKQGNATFNGTLVGAAVIDQVNPECTFEADTCATPPTGQVIINDYTEVLDIDNCNNITVADGRKFNVGDTILIIQMKGAVIDSANSAAFGNITDYKNAGNYQFNYIKKKAGNVLHLLNVITRPFDVDEGKVQVVRVPFFTDYIVTDQLTAAPWDGNKGGVLAFNVQNTLTLNNDIDVSNKGFRGGVAVKNPFFNCNIDSFYVVNNISMNGARKGEGVYSTVRLSGRGKLANGGGGGNSVNAGGAGGGNGGFGGEGGKQYVGITCNPNFPNGGVGGARLNYSNAQNKIFLGGGGGAGHGDDALLNSGGNGGGIVIVNAGTIVTNGFSIKADGQTPAHISSVNDDGRPGGGAGGTVLLNYNTITGTMPVSVSGGKGDNCVATPAMNLHGPGGGGGGGVLWINKASISSSLIVNHSGGQGGVNLNIGNNSWGATGGENGRLVTDLVLQVANTPYVANIDSVKIDTTIIKSCNNIFFEPLTWVRNDPIVEWYWDLGDSSSTTAFALYYLFVKTGDYTVRLTVTDANGCKDSAAVDVGHMTFNNFDFIHDQVICDPMTVKFTGSGSNSGNLYWNFGDGNDTRNTTSPSHTYSAPGNYTIKYSMGDHPCIDTITKYITINLEDDDVIATKDTTICAGTTAQLLTKRGVDHCWSPTTYLDDPSSQNPVTKPEQDIKYYYTAKIIGESLLVNGDFSQGTAGITTKYGFTPANTNGGQYFVGPNPQAWNAAFPACTDHTTGNGNMMMLTGWNGPTNLYAWQQTVTLTPFTDYIFSFWVQSFSDLNPARLRIRFDDQFVGVQMQPSTTPCEWKQFYTTWNSGPHTWINISLVNENTGAIGNDFALDDISFAPYFVKRDSVTITLERPAVRIDKDTSICEGTSVQLVASGAQDYEWTPADGLSATDIPDPVAKPIVPSEYIVTGTTTRGCIAKDTVSIDFYAKPNTTASADATLICKNAPVRLHASGGSSYEWSPGETLNDPLIADPIATPTGTTKYYVLVTDINTCEHLDSVLVEIRPDALFAANGSNPVCKNDSVTLTASGGNTYSWQPADGLSNTTIANPKASPGFSRDYTVTITEAVCNQSEDIVVHVEVLPLPEIDASSSNDIDCSTNHSNLSATGGQRYTWTPAGTLSNANAPNPVATPEVTTKYYVTGKDDASGCINYDSIIVKVERVNKGGYLMPNAFTPNGDGHNECYGIQFWGVIYELEFSIFNRWGERVFFTKDPAKCWDGTYKGARQAGGTFVYMIKAKTNCDPAVFRSGHFTLIR